jgi:hypothetical protein
VVGPSDKGQTQFSLHLIILHSHKWPWVGTQFSQKFKSSKRILYHRRTFKLKTNKPLIKIMILTYFTVFLFQVKEMPNVLILPRSADYSEEVWMEIREKAISILQTFFIDGVIPKNALSDAEEESEVDNENEQSDQQYKENALQIIVREQLDDAYSNPEISQKKVGEVKESSSQHQVSSLTLSTSARSEGRRSRSSKKAKKRHIRQKSQQKSDPSALEKEGTSHRDDTAMSGTDQALSSSSEDSRSRKTPVESIQEPIGTQALKSSARLSEKCTELLKDGCIIALHATDRAALYVSRQRVKGGGWILDSMPDVSKRDPAAQFLIIFRNKVCLKALYTNPRSFCIYFIKYCRFVKDVLIFNSTCICFRIQLACDLLLLVENYYR